MHHLRIFSFSVEPVQAWLGELQGWCFCRERVCSSWWRHPSAAPAPPSHASASGALPAFSSHSLTMTSKWSLHSSWPGSCYRCLMSWSSLSCWVTAEGAWSDSSNPSSRIWICRPTTPSLSPGLSAQLSLACAALSSPESMTQIHWIICVWRAYFRTYQQSSHFWTVAARKPS